jgi:hypothetical protein
LVHAHGSCCGLYQPVQLYPLCVVSLHLYDLRL